MKSEYEAEWDAETLAQAKKIEADKARLDRAKAAAQRMADHEAEKTKHLRQVAGGRKSSRDTGKKTQQVVSGGLSDYPSKPAPANSSKSSFNVFKRI